MKRMNIILLLSAMCIVLLSNGVIQAQSLKLEIGLSKEVYLEGEPIWLDSWLTNMSPDTIRTYGLCLPCRSEFKVEIRNGKGEIVPYTGETFDLLGGPGLVLPPQETRYRCYDLVKNFTQEHSLFTFFLTALDRGRYRVKAKYFHKRQVIESDELRFELKPPKGKEAKAYELLKGALQFYVLKKDSLLKENLSRILSDFPQSVYAPKACWNLRWYDELLEKFPDSGYSQNSVRRLTGETSELSEEEKQRFLQKVIKEHPKTRSARFAEQMLRLRH